MRHSECLKQVLFILEASDTAFYSLDAISDFGG